MKIKEKIGAKSSKWSNDRFWQNIRTTLSQINSGTECNRDIMIFFLQKEGINKIELSIKYGTNGSENVKKIKGVNHVEVPHYLQLWEWPPSPGNVIIV